MSRSLESTSFTTRPSMAISPPEISSRPASIRSKVDFPQPEGPTITTNSPSAISRLMPWMILNLPKFFSTRLNETAAMVGTFLWLSCLALDGTGREARHHVALEGVVDRRRRQSVDKTGGHQQFPRRIIGS